MALPIPEVWTVYGKAFLLDGSPFTQGKIKAFDISLGDGQSWQGQLGETGFGQDGSFTITYPRSAFQLENVNKTHPVLQVRIYDYQDRLLWKSDVIYDPLTNHNLNATLSGLPIIDGGNTVSGKVVNRQNNPLVNYKVNAYAVNFTSAMGFTELLLGTVQTNEHGNYIVSYDPNSVSGYSTLALYAEMVYDERYENGILKYKHILSPLAYNGSKQQIFNFVLDHESSNSISEFDEMNEVLNKYLVKVLEDSSDPNATTAQNRLANFLSDPPLVQYTVSAEAKDSHLVECYFRAFLVAYELQERFNVAKGNQTNQESKYNAQNYVQFFYAILRGGMILQSDELIKQDPTKILNCLLGAVSEQIIDMDSDVRGFIDLWNELFRTIVGDDPDKGEWTMYHILLLALHGYLDFDTSSSPPGVPLGESTKNLISNLLDKYYDSGSDARLFLETVRPVAGTTSLLNDVQFAKIEFLLDLDDFGENYRDMIQASFKYATGLTTQITSLEGMLVLTEENWKTIVSNASGLYKARTDTDDVKIEAGTLPPEFTGANGDEQRAIYARKLYKGLLAWFPQAELVTNITEEIPGLAGNELTEWQAVSAFLSNPNNPPYSLDNTNLGVYLKDNPNITLTEGVQKKIRWLQRLFRLTEHLPSIAYLISNEIMSAYDVAQITEDRFLAEHSVGLGGMNKARHIHRLAMNYTMNASFQISQYNAKLAMQGDSAPAVTRGLTPEGAITPQVQNTNIALPRVSSNVIANWKNLFGTINRNAVNKGQSILSPSAYLIDLLEFLAEGNGFDLLKVRRPDFWNLDLTKENAETALPMIDLAIELLEVLAAEKPLGSLSFQTTGTSEDLRAQPGHDPDSEATGELSTAVYPFVLPENFSREEARLILEKLGLSWRDLALAFPVENDSYQRRYLVVDTVLENVLKPFGSSGALDVWELWGLKKVGNTLFRPDKATEETNEDWDYILSIMAIFLDRSGLTLDGLQELLTLPIFAASGVKIHASAEAAQLGDINGFYLTITEDGVIKYSVPKEFAYNISRFVRLQRLLGWSFEELDAAWNLDLDNLDMVQDLSKTLKTSALEVIFWQRNMTKTMFARVFKPLGGDEEIFGLYENIEENGTTGEVNVDLFAGWICGRLGISRKDLELLIEKLGVSLTPEGDIAPEAVSRLHVEWIYRLSSFAKAVKLSLSDLFTLSAWLSLPNAKDCIEEEEIWTLSDCRQFSAKVQELQTNPLPYANSLKMAFAPDSVLQEKVETFLLSLAEAMDALRKQYKIPEFTEIPESGSEEALENAVIACLAAFDINDTGKVTLLESKESDSSEKLPDGAKTELKSWLQSLNENGVISISDDEIEELLALETVSERLQGLYSHLITAVVVASLAVFDISDTGEVALLESKEKNDSSEKLPDGAKTRLKSWLQSLNKQEIITASNDDIDSLLGEETVNGRLHGLYNLLAQSVQNVFESEVLNQLTTHFSTTKEVTKNLLRLLKSVNDDITPALEDWLAVTGTGESSLTAYVRFSKAALLVSALKLRTAEQLMASVPGVVADVLNALPILPIPEDEDGEGNEESESPISWDNFLPLLQVLRVLKDLDFQNEGYEKLVTDSDNALRLEKWNLRKSDLNALLGACGLDGSADYDPAKWMRFSGLLSLFRKSFTLPNVLDALLPAIPANDSYENYIANVALLRRNVMGSMSSSGWREFIQPINDGLRIRKRDALAAYICWKSQLSSNYYPLAFFDTNDLYAYYLTDVEMNPDMSGSRILQALNSIQQFVQRSLLGLEGKFTLTDEQKSYWEWMKNYRVWEAARKIFLYAENWIEPELRDDKTPFFKELEDKLMEVSDSPEFMEEALSEYLDKMRDVGGLQIVGACKEDGNGSALYILHVLGRTRGEPGVFYHRRYLAKALHGGEWTPWEKIDTEIQAVSVSMAIMNGNLYLFWPIIQHKEEEAEQETQGEEKTLGDNSIKSILELRLNWSFFNGKKWSGKKTTKSVLSHVLYDSYGHKLSPGESYEDYFHFQTLSNSSDFLEVKVYRTWYDYDVLEPRTLRTKVTDDAKTLKKVNVYRQSEFQMIEEFGEFQLWKDGRDEAVYYGNKWSRLNLANYTNSYPPANGNIIHNCWTNNGTLESYEEQNTYTTDALSADFPPAPHRHWFEPQYWYELRMRLWQNQVNSWLGNVAESVQKDSTRERVADSVDPSEFGKLVYPAKNVILKNIDGPHSLYPVNFSFYTGEHLPFFFMGEDKTYLVEEVARDKGATTTLNGNSAYRFSLLTHSLVDEFHKRYRSGGREYLYNRETEALPMAEGYYRSYSYYNYYFSVFLGYHIAGDWEAWDLSQSLFEYRYQPVKNAVPRPFPSPVTDFSWGSANGIYNWELFFHVPMRIAGKLTQEQRYAEAMDWLHMVFDPRMDLSTYERTKRWAQALPKGSRFWRFLPFFANKDADATILETLGMPSDRNKTPERDAIEALTDKWRSDPFNPHLIARARPAAYQKYVVMKYLDNLIAWADQLFTTDTMESINEAIQLYMLAAEILGPKSADTGEVSTDAMNVEDALREKKSGLGNIMIQVEDDLFKPNTREKTLPQLKLSAEAGQLVHLSGSMFYFGVPRNDKLLAYWDTVADRLYKIHNSLNIEGVKRTLALYAPPIDPGLLVRARAMGLDISSVLSSLSAPLPLYRFQIILQKAIEVVRDMQSLGATLLSTLEKKDGEALSLLRTEHEREMLTLNKTIRNLQIDEANAHLESLQKNKESAETRYNFYKNIEKISSKENKAITLTGAADKLQIAAMAAKSASAITAAFPNTKIGVIINAFGGPSGGATTGGSTLGRAAGFLAEAIQVAAQICRSEASMAQTMAGYERRWDDWKLQEQLAKTEMENLDKQILSSEIRINMAEKELENLERQIEQSDEIYDFMTSRFTGQELYTWMATELGRLYNDTFKQALTVAQRAERCYNFELGINDSFIRTDYWDGLRQGLLAGEHLLADLRRMDISFLEKNKRELEITRPVSLAQLNPGALRELQKDGYCKFKVPEVLFDMDFPGQYFRRIKSVRLEIPCNADPRSSISAKLSLLNNRLRISDVADQNEYGDSIYYQDNRIGIQSIATSQAQNDGGLFELNFRDERYLPFEGAGAISEWSLELPERFRQFDYKSISDVVLHISYTAKDAGGMLKDAAVNNIAAMWDAYQTISGAGLVQEICLSRHDYDSLQQLRAGLLVTLNVGAEDFPTFAEGASVKSVRILAKARNEGVSGFKLGIKLDETVLEDNDFSTPEFDSDKWTAIYSKEWEEGPSIDILGEWQLDASKNSEELLNNLGDIMIEYLYKLNGGN